eukprot:5341771-Prorocentrum_lima.AAC.1
MSPYNSIVLPWKVLWLSEERVQSLRNTSGDTSAIIANVHGPIQTAGGEGPYKPQERPSMNT